MPEVGRAWVLKGLGAARLSPGFLLSIPVQTSFYSELWRNLPVSNLSYLTLEESRESLGL